MNTNSVPKLNFMDLLMKPNKQDDKMFTKPIAHIHEFYLSGPIESSDQYIPWFDTIRHAGSSEIVKIYINSQGGDIFTAIQMMRVLSETDATVVVSVEGMCMSAATLIFLAADSFEVSEHTMFMFHNYSGGTMGKGAEMFDQLQHEKVWSERLMREVYEGFLTEAEITSVLDSKDIWMDGVDVIARLEKKKTDDEKEDDQEKQPD